MYKYIRRLATAISILINVVLGGKPNQTWSARNYQWKREDRWNIVWFINPIAYMTSYPLRFAFGKSLVPVDTNHCQTSWAYWWCRRDVQHEINKQHRNIIVSLDTFI